MNLKKLGRYELLRTLGAGAMGTVYEGYDPNLDRRVAIKTIRIENLSEAQGAEYEARFRIEARSAARLQHPNIVSVYDSDRDSDMAFLVMELIDGIDLKRHLDSGNVPSIQQTLVIMRDLLAALDYAHRQHVIHRDVKPANLMIVASGGIKLTDFGVARIQDSGEFTRTLGTVVGTLKYMSPEQVQGQTVDAGTDLFAAGVVLYQLLTGRRPFEGQNEFEIIQKIVGQHPVAPSSISPSLPQALDAVVARALQKSGANRFSSAHEFSTALLAAVNKGDHPVDQKSQALQKWDEVSSGAVAPPDAWEASTIAFNACETGTLERPKVHLLGSRPAGGQLESDISKDNPVRPKRLRQFSWLGVGILLLVFGALGIRNVQTATGLSADSEVSNKGGIKNVLKALSVFKLTADNPDAIEIANQPGVKNANSKVEIGLSIDPKNKCKGRWLLAFEMCMNNQCTKPESVHTVECVERKKLAQRQREADELRDTRRH